MIKMWLCVARGLVVRLLEHSPCRMADLVFDSLVESDQKIQKVHIYSFSAWCSVRY